MKKIAFTIVTKNYLWAARVLALKFHEYTQDSDFYVIVTDLHPSEKHTISIDRSEVISGLEVSSEVNYNDLAFIYNAFELTCVLRPFAHEFLFREKNADRVLFLDADIQLMSDAWKPFEDYVNVSILLSPHIINPTDIEDVERIDLSLLKSGVFNGGVLQLNRCLETMQFLKWFKVRQTRYGFHEMKNSSDQIWFNLIPLLFKDYRIHTDPGVNISWWNLHERNIHQSSANEWYVGDFILHSIHFSHWTPLKPEVLSRIFPQLIPSKSWLELSKYYSELCLTAGYKTCIKEPYLYNRFDDGRLITPWMRIKYSDMLANGQVDFKSPFAESALFISLDIQNTREQCISQSKSTIYSLKNYAASLVRPLFSGR